MSCFSGRCGVYLIAEIGGNHEGDFEYAKELTRLAATSGADAVKFQIYTGDSLVNPVEDPDRNRHFKKFQLTDDQYIELAGLCHDMEVGFIASVWNADSFDAIDPYIDIYKIGSGDLTAYNVIKRTTETGKPIILSTGLSTLQEVLDAVDFIRQCDERYITEKKLALLQCTSMYPIPDEDANLNVMHTLRERTSLAVGYSDHTLGVCALEAAVAMGAEILEMHFTDTREGKTFRDHKISVTQAEMGDLIERIQTIRTLLGSFEKIPAASEVNADHVRSFRRGIYPARDLAAGRRIQDADLVTMRPCHGLSAVHFYDVVGRILKTNVSKYQPLSWELFK